MSKVFCAGYTILSHLSRFSLAADWHKLTFICRRAVKQQSINLYAMYIRPDFDYSSSFNTQFIN